MTHEQYTNECCKGQQRTAAYRLKAALGVKYSMRSELTPEQIKQIDEYLERSKGKSKQRNVTRAKATTLPAIYTDNKRGFVIAQVPTETQPQTEIPQPKAQKSSEAQVLFIGPFVVNLLSIALTVWGLYLAAGFAGVLFGAMFSITLFTAVVVSRNANFGVTSESNLETVLYMECGALLLHPFTFYNALPDVSVWLRVGASLVMSAFVAKLSYNAVLTVRNYNAEKLQLEEEEKKQQNDDKTVPTT